MTFWERPVKPAAVGFRGEREFHRCRICFGLVDGEVREAQRELPPVFVSVENRESNRGSVAWGGLGWQGGCWTGPGLVWELTVVRCAVAMTGVQGWAETAPQLRSEHPCCCYDDRQSERWDYADFPWPLHVWREDLEGGCLSCWSVCPAEQRNKGQSKQDKAGQRCWASLRSARQEAESKTKEEIC